MLQKAITQKAANGEVLTDLKTLRFRVFEPGNKISHLTTIQARPGMVFTEEGIQRELEKFSEMLDKTFPQQQFRLVELSRGQFNFINEPKSKPIWNPV
jgi:hypothetical protein